MRRGTKREKSSVNQRYSNKLKESGEKCAINLDFEVENLIKTPKKNSVREKCRAFMESARTTAIL